MRQRFHTTICRRTLTLLGLVGLAAWLVLPGSSLAGKGIPQAGNDMPNPGAITAVTLPPPEDEDVHFLAKPTEGIQPQDLVGLGATAIFTGFNVPPGRYAFSLPWSFISFTTRVFVSASEQPGFWGGAILTIYNVVPRAGNTLVIIDVSAAYILSQLNFQVLAIN
jgi:hypothetical protein